MKLLMISGDRSLLQGRKSAFYYTLQEFRQHWERIDVICPWTSRVDVSIGGNGTAPHATADRQGGEVHLHPCPHGLWYQTRWIARRGCSLIKEHKHHVMTVHEYPPFYNGMGAAKLHRKTGIPYALEIHHIVGWPEAANVRERLGRTLSRLYLGHDASRAAAVRTVNAAAKHQLEQWVIPAQKIHVVPSFYLDGDLLRSDTEPPKSYDMVFSGRLVPNKGLGNVIDTLKFLPDARLLVIGEGPERAVQEARARKLGFENRVTFLGWLPTQEAVLGAVRTARVFVMTSTSEGGPRNALEAIGAGMPCVFTPVGVLPDIVRDGENAIFTDGTPQDIAAKVGALLQDEERRARMGDAARGVLDQFERRALVETYAKFLQSLAT